MTHVINFCVANFCNKLATIPASMSPRPGSKASAAAGSWSCMSDSTCKSWTSNDAGGTILDFSNAVKEIFIEIK